MREAGRCGSSLKGFSGHLPILNQPVKRCFNALLVGNIYICRKRSSENYIYGVQIVWDKIVLYLWQQAIHRLSGCLACNQNTQGLRPQLVEDNRGFEQSLPILFRHPQPATNPYSPVTQKDSAGQSAIIASPPIQARNNSTKWSKKALPVWYFMKPGCGRV